MSRRKTDPLVADQVGRSFAQSEFDHPVVVVAGAGTGKTALLVARVAAWCVGPGWDRHAGSDPDRHAIARRVIERVVAITFTEAAAAEMARKIGFAFLELASAREPIGWNPQDGLLPEDIGEISDRAGALSEEGHRLVVSTIHAFCQRLLATYPLEAQLHPHFEVDADGTRIEALAEEVVEESLRGLSGNPDRSSWERLALEGVGPSTLVEALCDLVDAGVESTLFRDDPFDSVAVRRITVRLGDVVGRFRTIVGNRLENVRGPNSVETRDVVDALSERLDAIDDPPSLGDLEDMIDVLGDKAIPRLKKWSRRGFTGSERDCLGDIAPEAAIASGELAAWMVALTRLVPEQLAVARQVVGPLLDNVEQRRNAAGLITFADLLRRSVALLENSPGVRLEVTAGIDHLLVDEFQDTDDVQCRLVELLALSGEPDRRPALFIVGDPKQSIYAWRSADLAAYDDFVRKVVKGGGATVDLVRNFRSVTPILDEVERMVAPVMRSEPGIQPAFQALEATEERRGAAGVNAEPWRTVEHWVTWPRGAEGVGPEKGNSDRETSSLEARAIAADIRRLRAAGVIERWGDVAVLLRVTTSQELLLEAFREAEIPYEVASERDYYRQREVVELAALVRCVLEPADLLALLTIIRSDVVGVPDDALTALWDAGFPGAIARLAGPGAAVDSVMACIETARKALPGSLGPGVGSLDWMSTLRAAVENIAELRISLRLDPPDAFVEKIRTLWLAEPTAAARYLGGFRRARIDRFLSDLEATLISGEGGDADLARFLRRAVEEGGDSRVPTPPDLEIDAVHVMTIHRAKGLDFEHVYVAQIHKGGRGGSDRKTASIRTIDDRQEYALFGWMTPGFAAAEWVQERKTRAELVRLLYVATTRAKNRLVVSGDWGKTGDDLAPESASNFAKLLGRRLDQGDVAAQIQAENERADDGAPDVLRVMPVFGGDGEETSRGVQRDAPWSLSAERLKMFGALADARMSAADRMAQTVFKSASAEAHDRLRQIEAEEGDAAGEGTPDRDLAMALGTAVHGLLETLDLGFPLAPQVAERHDQVIDELVAGRIGDEARTRTERLLNRLAGGDCLVRLETIASTVVARELPVMLWVEEESVPGAVVSGLIDLVYRDPVDGRLVVADYKTDSVSDESSVEERAQVYEPQVRTYGRALRVALDLDYEPHVELWFLHADQIVRL